MSLSFHLIHCMENWMTPFFNATLLLSPVGLCLFVQYCMFICSYFFFFLCLEIQLLPVIRRSSSLWNWKDFLQSFSNSCQEATVHFARHGWAKSQKDRGNLPQSQIYNTGGGFLWFFWSVSHGQSDKENDVSLFVIIDSYDHFGHLYQSSKIKCVIICYHWYLW